MQADVEFFVRRCMKILRATKTQHMTHMTLKAKAVPRAPLILLLFVVKIETLVEAVNTSACINELLLACKERMAF